MTLAGAESVSSKRRRLPWRFRHLSSGSPPIMLLTWQIN